MATAKNDEDPSPSPSSLSPHVQHMFSQIFNMTMKRYFLYHVLCDIRRVCLPHCRCFFMTLKLPLQLLRVYSSASFAAVEGSLCFLTAKPS